MSYVQNSKKPLKMLVSELEQSQEQPGNTSETFMSSQTTQTAQGQPPILKSWKSRFFA